MKIFNLMSFGNQELLYLLIVFPITILFFFNLIAYLVHLIFNVNINFIAWNKKIIKYYYLVVLIVVLFAILYIYFIGKGSSASLKKIN